MNRQTIDEIYKIKKEANQPLLSNYPGEFWASYRANFAIFDRLYARMYKSFEYIERPEENTEQSKVENAEDFTADVFAILTKNAKKYSEIYRVENVDDGTYSMLENYDLNETMNRTATEGERTDERETTEGARTDNETATQGQQSNTTTQNFGTETTTETTQVAPYDSEAWNNKDKTTTDNSKQADTTTEQLGQRQDTRQSQKGQQVDNETNTKGEQTNTETYNMRRHGNIGTQTASQVMELHADFWKNFDFYQMIFNDILKEILMVGGC
jgi:hypothetical protein